MPNTLKRLLRSGLLTLFAALLAACGGGEDRTKAQVRLINASTTHGALDLLDADGRRVQASVAFAAAEGYAEVDPKDADFDITRAGNATALATAAPTLTERHHYGLVAYATRTGLAAVLLDEEVAAPDSGKARVRVLNAATDAGALDVFLTTTAADLAGAEPLQAGAAPGAVSALTTVDAASWRLRVTGSGDRDDLRLDLPAVVVGNRSIVTVVLTPTAGGLMVDALVVAQQGSISAQAGTSARVRVVAGATDSAAVSATVGGVTLMNGTGSPAAGSYRLVPAGAAGAEVQVNGAAVTTPALTLAAGQDYSLLVWGAPAAARASWLADDNRLPTVSGRAKLRLVHGLADVSEGLAVTLDFNPVADGVSPGTASAPASLNATTIGSLSVTAPGRASPLWTAADQVLAADRVYTLFMVGREAAPTGILRADR